MGTILRQPDSFEHPDSVGHASPGVEVKVRDPTTGEVRGENEVGEIHLRTGSLFLGYWNDLDTTRGAVDAERWYATGDLGRVTAGFLHLAGRCHELIIRAGENVYPVEIENRLLEHPLVAEVAVVEVDHRRSAEVRRWSWRTGTLTDDVRRWAGDALAPFKVPAHIEFRDSLPYNTTGKIMKQQLTNSDSTDVTVRGMT